ncbi:unnamed protein product [Acanthoscelides obtectus]|uniref:DUF7869 domain-containing protein n=2 Tax=Acanthoscelides obtectus TaxID=200917 RepID=A0A9P0PVI0_ACAOB|nr:unnamed protein product [Acanthoscelides obtectus]CAK1643545.1 hypothetical protein AOBTE_LOCUS13572 [Acanthoscelides obtectus]
MCDLNKTGQGQVECFMWHEGQGRRGSNEIGSCLLKYLEYKASAQENVEVVFYSDNCAGQQKNKFILAGYFYALSKYNIKSITHKYLIRGHTQNEGDNVHSVIEKHVKRALKSGPIYTPDQYVSLVQTAKKTGLPYKVQEMSYADFVDLKKLSEQTSFNFKKDSSGEVVKLANAAIIRIEKENLDKFLYKTSYSEPEYRVVEIKQRTTRTNQTFDNVKLEPAYRDILPISKKKYDGLMFLLRMNTIKKCYSPFYNSLKVSNDVD